MHARIDQLLSLRDGEPVDATVRAHVQQCAQCLAEAAHLAKARIALQTLPALEPPADGWPDIEARLAAPATKHHSLRFVAAAAAIVVSLVALLVVRDQAHGPQHAELQQSTVPMPAAANDTDMQQLIAQSRELDELLQYLPERPQVERVSLAATVDTIEERIQVLDWQLAYGSDAGLDHRQAQRLWSERVELMDSLVKVRYAESAPMTF